MNIRELIRERIAAAESVHVRELSEGIAESVPSEELRDALRECLPHLIREVLNSTRPPVVVPAPAPAYSAKIARRREMARVLQEAGINFALPQGAFYFFPEAPGGDDLAFVDRLLAQNILAVPGRGFGSPGYFRLSFSVDIKTITASAAGFKRAAGQA